MKINEKEAWDGPFKKKKVYGMWTKSLLDSQTKEDIKDS